MFLISMFRLKGDFERAADESLGHRTFHYNASPSNVLPGLARRYPRVMHALLLCYHELGMPPAKLCEDDDRKTLRYGTEGTLVAVLCFSAVI